MENIKAGIGIYDGKKINVITVEKDGSPAFLGSFLYAKYQSRKRVEKLLDLGDLFVVREKINPVSNLGHYVLKNNGVPEEIRLQEDVTVSKFRDIRNIENNIIKRNKKKKAREYTSPRMAFNYENIEYLYVFDIRFEDWETYAIDNKTSQFGEIHPNYVALIKNLYYRDDISPLTKEEKEKLKYK